MPPHRARRAFRRADIEPGETGSIKDRPGPGGDRTCRVSPFEGRRRVTIIDQADALVDSAQNALLKTLEEPLPASVFILVTSRPDVLLPTVRSRCAHLRFGRLQSPKWPSRARAGQGYSQADALTAAAVSDGSVRRALDIEAGEFADARNDAEHLLRWPGGIRDASRAGQASVEGDGAAPSEREHLGARLQAISVVAARCRFAGERRR